MYVPKSIVDLGPQEKLIKVLQTACRKLGIDDNGRGLRARGSPLDLSLTARTQKPPLTYVVLIQYY